MDALTAMKQALDALEYGFVDEPYQRKEKAAIIALRAAIDEMGTSVLMPRSPDYEMYMAFDRAIVRTSMFISTFDRCYAAMVKEIDERGNDENQEHHQSISK